MNSAQAHFVLYRISEAKGTNAKKKILGDNLGLKPYLRAAYNPFYKYYIQKFPDFDEGGMEVFEPATWNILRALKDREITGDYAKRILFQQLEVLESNSRDLLIKIMKHDLRIGLGIKSINDVFPGLIPEFGVMLASKLDWNKVHYPIFTSPKLDGVRAYYSRGKLYTRSGHTIIGCDHIIESIQNHLEKDTPLELDGELMIPDMGFDKGSGRIRSLQATPEAIYNVFDIPSMGDRPFIQRETALVDMQAPGVRPINHYMVKNQQTVMHNYEVFRAWGYEGAVLKSINHIYQRKRSTDWIKMKAVDTKDLQCIGFFEGTGKYVGMLGGIIVLNVSTEVRVGSGFSDDDRKYIWDNRPDFFNKIAEVLFQEETVDNSLRHPRFLRWRFDK